MRKFYAKNVLDFNKKDLDEREVDDVYADFNKALDLKDHFILDGLGKLEEDIEGMTLCTSKLLRDFINK